MAIETQQISADNVVETDLRVFAHPDDLGKLDLLQITAPTDIDYLLNKVDSIQNPIQDMGEFDPTIDGMFPEGAMSGWLYRVANDGDIGSMSLSAGDTIFAIADVVDRTDPSLWVKIDNTEGNDILRTNDIDTDPTMLNATDETIGSALAVKSYVDTMVMDLNTTLMTEIEAAGQSSTSAIKVTDWVDIVEDGTDSLMVMIEPPAGIVRIYIEAWGDIVDGWTITPGIPEVRFTDDVEHIGKRVKITYLVN